MIRQFYYVVFKKGSGFEDIRLEEERGKKLGELWLENKNQTFEINGSYYDGLEIKAIIKQKENIL